MRTPTSLAAALLLLVAGSANATILLTVTNNLGDPTPDLDLQVDIELINVSGGGLLGIGFDIVVFGGGVASNVVGFDWSSMIFFGVQPDGTNAGWGDFVDGPTDGFFPGILTFSVSCCWATLGGPNLYAADDSFNNITDTIVIVSMPEPTPAALLGLGLVGLALRRRHR